MIKMLNLKRPSNNMKIKNIFKKSYTQNWSEKMFSWLEKLNTILYGLKKGCKVNKEKCLDV